jgi:excinuclease ABC subunit C
LLDGDRRQADLSAMASKDTRDLQPETATDATPDLGHRDGASGAEVIARYLKQLPSSPGVYRMLDREGNVVYVGKARNLKARVSNYARLGGHTNRIARMISATSAMEFVTVRTEAEALLL